MGPERIENKGLAEEQKSGHEVIVYDGKDPKIPKKNDVSARVVNQQIGETSSLPGFKEVAKAGDFTLLKREEKVNGRKRTSYRVKINGENPREERLTKKLFELLEVFMVNPNKVLTRKYLIREVWQTDYMGDTRTLDVHIHYLRQKIEEDPKNPSRVVTLKGIGYEFVA